MKPAGYWIEKLRMQQHPEGGWFKEVYRSEGLIPQEALPPDFGGVRNFSTSIYFLLQGDQFSGFHRIKSDELWHFYSGSPLNIFQIDNEGLLHEHHLGLDIEAGEGPQLVITKNTWFASRLKEQEKDNYALVGCTVAPGFNFVDFELAEVEILSERYPQHVELIQQLCVK